MPVAVVDGPGPVPAPEPASEPGRSRVSDAWAPLVVAAVAAVVAASNLWWISARRRGLPFDIDEAGYLQRAVRNADALHGGGIGRLIHVVRQPDPQAPLLPVLSGMVRYVTGAGPTQLVGVEALFTVVLIVATYLAARRVTSQSWAVLAAVVVACLPGVVDNGRQFAFALPATAMVTAVLAAQLRAGDFSATRRSLVWGSLLGLAALTRTMVLGLLACLVLAAAVRLVAEWLGRGRGADGAGIVQRRSPARPFLNAAAGLTLSVAVSMAWYSASWHAVVDYLTSYGYGTRAAAYGSARSLGSWSWWTFRFTRVMGTAVLWPIAVALGLCIVIAVVSAFVSRRGARTSGARPTVVSGVPGLRERLARPVTTLGLFVAAGYLLVSSTRNNGSSFELPLVPAAVILIMVAVSRAPTTARRVAAVACIGAALVAFSGQGGVVPGHASTLRELTVGPVSMPVFDSRGSLMRYRDLEFGACSPSSTCPDGGSADESSYLPAWSRSANQGAGLLRADARARGRDPVVFFAVQDAFFNTNSVDLAYQVAFHQVLPTGLLRAPEVAGRSMERQLDAPELGQPNLVLVGPASEAPRAHELSPQPDPAPVVAALRASGFTAIDSLRLPDGRVMQVWWRDRGPTASP